MATIEIPERVLKRLRELAERENRTIGDVVEEAVDNYAPKLEDRSQEETPNAFMMLAQVADELDISSGRGDLSTRSREILKTDFPDYLMRRLREQRGDKRE